MVQTFTAQQGDFFSNSYGCVVDESGAFYLVGPLGIVRYDGANWVPLPSFQYRLIRDIEKGPDGRIVFSGFADIGWIETAPGKEPTYRSFYGDTPPDRRPQLPFFHVAAIPGGAVALGGKHLLVAADGQLPRLIQLPFWGTLLFSIRGQAYILGGESVLYRLGEDNRLEPVAAGRDLVDAYHPTLCTPASNGSVYLGTVGGWVLRFDGKKLEAIARISLSHSNRITSLAALSDGSIAVGTSQDGVRLLDTSGQERGWLNRDSGLPDNRVRHLVVDTRHGLWVISGSSVARVEVPSSIRIFNEQTGFTGSPAAVAWHQGRLYVGTDQGLFVSNPSAATTGQLFSPVPSSPLHIISLLSTPAGLLLSGGDSVACLQAEGIHQLLRKNANHLFPLQSRPGEVLVGSTEGVERLALRDGRWEILGAIPGFTQAAYGFAEDGRRRIWIKVGYGRIVRMTLSEAGASFSEFGEEAGLPPEHWINPIVTPGGNTLISAGGQLLRWDEATSQAEPERELTTQIDLRRQGIFAEEVGAPGGPVWCIRGYGDGRLLPAPKGDFLRALHYMTSLEGSRCLDFVRDPSGVLWLAFPGGLVRHDSAAASPPETGPVILRSLYSLGSAHPILSNFSGESPEIDLPWQDRSLRVDVSLAYAIRPEKNRYRILLDGLETEVGQLDPSSTREYINLAPGQYTLRVEGMDSSGRDWAPVVVPLRIHPPWYRTPTILTLGIIAAASLAYGSMRWRLSRLRQRTRALEQAVADRTQELSKQTELLHEKNLELMGALQTAEALTVEAKAASEAKSRFLANMSHEIRTPMNGVIGMCSVLTETDLSPEQAEYLSTIRNSSEALLRILNDILDLSRVEAGKLSIEQSPFGLADVVEETAELFAPQAARAGVELVIHIESDVPPRVVGDAVRLRQVLGNLVGNAVKFTRSGHILVRVRTCPELHGNHLVRFEVRDTGTGIPKDKLDLLFQPFSQVDASTVRKYGGAGLGLAICRHLVGLMGGSIWATRADDHGTIFQFTISLPPDSSRPPLPIESAGGGRRVLVVDDLPESRAALCQHARRHGLMPSEAANTATALRLLTAHPHAAILLDYTLPGSDALQFAQELRRKPEFASIPLVLLLPEGDPGLAATKETLARQAQAILAKPVRRMAIDRILAECLQSGGETDTATAISALSRLPRLSSLRVVVAEDNAINLRIAQLTLKRLGVRAEGAPDGETAVRLVLEKPCDLLLLDTQMPGLGGLDVVEAIRRAAPSRRTRIVVMAGGMDLAEERSWLDAGADGFIPKPFDAEDAAAELAIAHGPA